jgi:hypothetical protein
MPIAVERALRKAAKGLARKGELKGQKKGQKWDKAINHMVYGTMTNMQKAGKIPAWRKLKH